MKSSCQMRVGGRHRFGAIERSEEDGTMVRFCMYCTTPQSGSQIPKAQRYWFEQLERMRKENRA